MNLLSRLLQDFVGLLYPNHCCGCLRLLYAGESLICTDCLFKIPYTDYHLNAENRVAKQFWGRIPFTAAMALLHFKKGSRVQNLLHQLKYRNQQQLGHWLGERIGEKLLTSNLYDGIAVIVPVPMHGRKQRKRGYNQSMCIADGISAILKVPVNSTALLKIKETSTQTNKGRLQRHENMKAVFKVVKPMELVGKHVLLIDDVITTGATAEACATEILACQGTKLSIAAVAFAD